MNLDSPQPQPIFIDDYDIADSPAMAKARDIAFPKFVLKGTLGELAYTLAQGSEVAPELAFGAALTVLGSVVTGKLESSMMASDTRLYTILLGASYSAKKSTAMRNVVGFFRNHVMGDNPLTICNGVGSAEGLMKAIEESGGGLKAFESRLLLCYDELEAFFKKAGIEGSVLLQAVASLFESTHYESRTKTHHIEINGAKLSFLACCTLATYEHCWSPEALAIGLDNRLFLVNAEVRPPVAWPSGPSFQEQERIAKEIRVQLAQLGNAPLVYEGTEAAKNRYTEWYDSLFKSDSPYIKRLPTIASRLMMLQAFSQHKDVIDTETIDQVIAICDHQKLLRECYAPVDVINEQARMEHNIKRKLREKGSLTDAALRKFTNAARVGSWCYRNAISGLVEAGEIRRTSVSGVWTLIQAPEVQ